MPDYFKGVNFILYIFDGVDFLPIACMRSNTSSQSNEQIDVTSKCSMPFRTSINGGLQTVSFSGSGVMNDGADIAVLIAAANFNLITRFKMESEYGDTYEGNFTPTSFERSGEHADAEMFDLTLESAGPIVYTTGTVMPPDVTNWYEQVVNPSVGASTTYKAITSGDGVIMMVAEDFSNDVYATVTTDGVNFVERGLVSQAAPQDRVYTPSIAYGNGTFVVIDTIDEFNRYSTDNGVTWLDGTLTHACEGMAFGNGVFVAGSRSTSLVYVSADGITWTQYNLPAIPGNNHNSANCTYCDGAFVIMCLTHCFKSTDNGQTWTAYEYAASLSFSGNIHAQNAFGDGKLVATTGLPYQTVVSLDKGETWTANAVSIGLMDAYQYGDGVFVGIRDTANEIYTSTDAENWTNHLLASGGNKLAYMSGIFVGCSATGATHAVSNISP